jgi:hypothetical protein
VIGPTNRRPLIQAVASDDFSALFSDYTEERWAGKHRGEHTCGNFQRWEISREIVFIGERPEGFETNSSADFRVGWSSTSNDKCLISDECLRLCSHKFSPETQDAILRMHPIGVNVPILGIRSKAPCTHPHPLSSARPAPESGIAAAWDHARHSERQPDIPCQQSLVRTRLLRARSSPTRFGCCR